MSERPRAPKTAPGMHRPERFVVIPTTLDTRSRLVWNLIREAQDVATVVIVRTRPGSEPVPGTVDVDATMHHLHFQRWVNAGLERCTGPALVLNDDILISSSSIAEMLNALSTHDLVTLPKSTGVTPISGWCLGLAEGIRYDEAYRWWYGDDDLWERMLEERKRIAVVDVPVVHHRNRHAKYPAELRSQVAADRATFARKWRGGSLLSLPS